MDNKGKQPKVKIFMGKAKIKQQVGRSVDSQTLDWKIDIQPTTKVKYHIAPVCTISFIHQHLPGRICLLSDGQSESYSIFLLAEFI